MENITVLYLFNYKLNYFLFNYKLNYFFFRNLNLNWPKKSQQRGLALTESLIFFLSQTVVENLMTCHTNSVISLWPCQNQ